MGNIGDTMASVTVPPVGTAGTAYATQVNSFLTEVKGRLEAKVPLSSLQPGELNLLNNPITNVQYLGLYPQAVTPVSPVGSLQTYGDELFWVSAAGAVQITSVGLLNAAGIGGITGDYGSPNPAQFRFSDTDQTYFAYDDYGLGNWARFAARSVDVYGSVAGASRARVTWAGSTSYTITLPAAAPASTGLVQMTSAGVMSAGAAVAENIVLAVDKKVVLSGTGVIAHGEYSEAYLCAQTYVLNNPGGSNGSVVNGSSPAVTAPNSLPVDFHFPMRAGQRIRRIVLHGTGQALSTTPTVSVSKVFSGGTVIAEAISLSLTFGVATGFFEYTIAVTSNMTLGVGDVPTFRVTTNGAPSTLRSFVVVYDQA